MVLEQPFNRRWTECTQMEKIRTWMDRMNKMRRENELANAESTRNH
jgi:hypothetical protein